MTSENDIGTITRKSSNLSRLFTSSGRLNSLALEGDIKIRAGENIHVLAGGNINMTATNQLVFTGGSTLADMLGASGIQSYTGSTAPASPNTGDLWFDTGNYNVCKRWSGSEWTEYTQGKLSNSKMTLDATGISLLSGGTFTVASTNFMIDSSGNVSVKGAITADTGYIGGTSGFAIQSAKLYSGKSSLTGTDAGVYVGTDGISLGSAGVAPQFKVTSAGALTASDATITGAITATSGSFTGSLYSSSGTIGGFTIASGALSAQASGKPLLKLDTANSEITLGAMTLSFNDTDGSIFNSLYPFVFNTHESLIVMDDSDTSFYTTLGTTWCNGVMSALSFTDRP
jgi:hypothetical protein